MIASFLKLVGSWRMKAYRSASVLPVSKLLPGFEKKLFGNKESAFHRSYVINMHFKLSREDVCFVYK